MTSKQALETDIASVNSKTAAQVESTDLIPLFRPNQTTGRDELIGKIPRSELMSAVQTSLGTLLNSGSNQTTVAKVPTLNGNTLGASTIATLASALGVTMLRRSRQAFSSLSTLQSAVADQNLEKYGLAVGDYITINGYDYVIAGLNVMKGSTSPYRVTSNHVGLIVISHTTHAWNSTGNTYASDNNGGAGFKNSDLHYYLRNTILPHVQSDLGSSNLISHHKLLSNAVNTSGYNRFGDASGCSSSLDWEADSYISALSEVQVYGSVVWSSSGYDTGEACRQLDVFRRFNMNEIFGGEYPWLRDVVSSSSAASVHDRGFAAHYTASYTSSVAGLILFH